MRTRLNFRILIYGGVVVGLGLLGWGVHTFVFSGSRTEATAGTAEDHAAKQAEERDWAGEADAIIQRSRELLTDGEEDPALSERLACAIRRMEELIRRNPPAGGANAGRLEKMEEARDTLRARADRSRIVALEATAEMAPDESAAIAARREALALQQQINRSAAHNQWKDFARETRLARQLVTAEAAPWRAEAASALTEAEAAGRQEDWTRALAAYERARTALTEINVRFPGARTADIALLDRIAAEIVALEPAEAARAVDEREKAAEAAQAAGRAAQAMELYTPARMLQSELNERYPRSRFVSRSRVDELESRRQTVGAQELLDRAVELDPEAEAHLLKREVIAAAAKVDEATARLRQLAAEFPRSCVQPGALKLKLAYLAQRRGVLTALQDEVYAQLVPVPGEKNLLMPGSELAPELFAQVMNIKPGRQTGPGLPVDALDQAEAQEFCRRLSWLLGTPVRLPTERESVSADAEKMSDATNRRGFRFVVEYPLPDISP